MSLCCRFAANNSENSQLPRGGTEMQFGYFTLSDNHYRDNRRGANEFVADIMDEALYAEEVGLHSAWIGEHHFSTLGVLSCPDLVMAQDRKSTRLNSSHIQKSRMPSSA